MMRKSLRFKLYHNYINTLRSLLDSIFSFYEKVEGYRLCSYPKELYLFIGEENVKILYS